MMGQLPSGQSKLFYEFCLEKHIPTGHLVRQIERFLDFAALREHLARYDSTTGRPSVDPELMLRMLIIGYCYKIRSERRLCEEVNFNLAYRWFCRLGLEAEVPDHSTSSKNHHGRFRESGLFRTLFEEVVRRCMQGSLVGGEGFAVDASIVRADANRQRGVPGAEAPDWTDPTQTTRAVREYLEALDGREGSEPVPKNMSLTDPMASWTAAPGGPAFYACSTYRLVDVEHGVILDVEATPVHCTTEVGSTKTMIDRVEDTFELVLRRLIGDMAYGSASMPGWIDEKSTEPHVPVWDKTQRTNNTLSSTDFQWDERNNEYRYPQGHA